MSTDPDIVGYAGAVLTTVAFVPQAVQALRTRDTASLSLPMYLLFVVGVACWLAYGIVLHSWPIILSNGCTLVLSLLILGAKIRLG